MKRLVDFLVAAIMLIVLSPLMLVLGIAIAATMGMPVVYKQRRPGYRGREFSIYKFRTMADCCDIHGNLLPDCVRETRLGRFLRGSSLDELPQLINILLGQMSIVGPRPLMRMFIEDCSPEQMRRFDVRPGVAGLAQVHGRKALDYDKRFALDVWYVDNHSLWLDFKIILSTVDMLIRREGLTESGEMVSGGVAAFMAEPRVYASDLRGQSAIRSVANDLGTKDAAVPVKRVRPFGVSAG